MKKNNFIKIFMSVFAIFASIGGVLFLFRDKISNFIESIHNSNHLCKKLFSFSCFQREKNNSTASDILEYDEDEFSFEHAFDEDPTTSREYVSLNINTRKTEEENLQIQKEDSSFL